MSADDDILLQVRGVSKSFPGVRALDHVDLTGRRGRLLALVGENGAGKSTLMNILAGVFPPDAGEVLLAGRQVRFANPRAAQLAGIAIIFQELNLVDELSVAENIFLGREPLTRLGLIDYRAMHREARALLAQLELAVDPRTPVGQLRVGARQVVEIAKALSLDARLIIMDEPTSAISDHEVQVLFRLIRQLKARGVGIIYITHKLDELPHIADDIAILRDGKLIRSDRFAALSHDEIIRMMVGRELAPPRANVVATGGDEALTVRGLSLRSQNRPGDLTLRDVSLSIRAGEIVGLFGLMGAGRTELLQSIFGLHPHLSTGEILVGGRPVRIRSPRDAIRAGLALAPEDRKTEGLILSMTAAENANLAALPLASRWGLLRPRRERAIARRYTERLGVKSRSLGQSVRQLSGGNQQKIVLAKWLATSPRVLLLDEPTRGIDIHAKREMYTLIGELAATGMAIVMVSSELPEILAVADRILVLAEGRLRGEFSRHEASEETILKAALPRTITTANDR